MELKEELLELLGRTEQVSAKPARRPGLKRVRRNAKPRTAMISVIVPAHNEEAYLQRTLAALARQDYPAVEVIVVANGCDDNTAGVARGRCHRLVVLSQKSLGVARNLGARMARGDLLVFLDADTMLDPTALRTIAEQFSRKEAAGTIKGQPDNDRFMYKLVYGLKNFMHRFVLRNGSSGVIICWKKHFVRLGGFDERLEIRENSELIRRLKRFGKYKYIRQATATTSMRRYERQGLGRMVWLWTRLWVRSLFGDLHHRKYDSVR